MLAQRCILGRSRACTIRLLDPDVSGEHALLRWSGGAWELQDLHSRNGTFVDGRRLASGERTALTVGAVIGLGRSASFVLGDAEAPTLFATPLVGGSAIEARSGILALPEPSAPEAMVFRLAGGWVVERGGDATAVVDGEILRIGGEAWQLHLPELLPQTADSGGSLPDLDNITLRFNVSRDEEYVEVLAQYGASTIDLKARSHHYTLLVLARARLRDRTLPSDRQGWIHQNDLLGMLRIDAGHLHLNIYRLRQQFGEAGIGSAARIVERRAGTRQLRIGAARMEVHVFEHAR